MYSCLPQISSDFRQVLAPPEGRQQQGEPVCPADHAGGDAHAEGSHGLRHLHDGGTSGAKPLI